MSNLTPEYGAAINRAKTKCPRGHEYSETNTYRHNNKRHCRECRRVEKREYQRRRRLAEKNGDGTRNDTAP